MSHFGARKGKHRRGICPACKEDFAVSKDGTPRTHWVPTGAKDLAELCPGTDQQAELIDEEDAP